MIYDPAAYKFECPTIPLKHPPCAGCAHWNPQMMYFEESSGFVPDGVRLCHRGEMHHDFSCFKEREANVEVVVKAVECIQAAINKAKEST